MEKRMGKSIVKNIGYSLLDSSLELSLNDVPYLVFVTPSEIHFGGKNCEISQLVVGSKIKYELFDSAAVRNLTNVTVMSDGIREVDDDGNLIKW